MRVVRKWVRIVVLAGKDFWRLAELAGVVGHMVPLREALVHKLLEPPETLRCRRDQWLLCLLSALQNTQPCQERMELMAQQCRHVFRQPLQIERKLEIVRRR